MYNAGSEAAMPVCCQVCLGQDGIVQCCVAATVTSARMVSDVPTRTMKRESVQLMAFQLNIYNI
jgi:hypothetical protein